ncbi:MAG: hypothetical protein U5P10_03400 [Spirochaetia bacterium]|nr:hypothetical protein [Spirochaetia bacterium]
MTAVIINIIALGAFAVAFSRNRKKALKSIKVATKMFLGILPMLIIIILLIGLLFGFVSGGGAAAVYRRAVGTPGSFTGSGNQCGAAHTPRYWPSPLSLSTG